MTRLRDKPLRDMTADELRARAARIREMNPTLYDRLQTYRNTMAALRRKEEPPAFKRVASGDYETADGRFRLYQLVDVRPPAWNVEEITYDTTTAPAGAGYDGLPVDGAASKRDALAIFAEWWKGEQQ